MEETSVVVVGGGPVGTLLGALLSHNYQIPTIVLEKDTSIPQDPRAFSLTEDGIRCLQDIGLYDDVYTKIGTARGQADFITGRHHDLNAKPMLAMKLSEAGSTGHTRNIMFNQPVMEKIMRQVIHDCPAGDFRAGAEVIEIKEDKEHAEITYREAHTGQTKTIRTKFIVGTDGRRGFVRKQYLEPRGVLLERVNDLEPCYVGMNWDILMPTPKTHPTFPLWAKGYSPEEVLEAFMPSNFKFMCNPERNGVFSCAGVWNDASRLWRTEFALCAGENPEVMSKQEEVARLVKPYMTHPGKRYGVPHDVTFPEDCMQPRRSWFYKFESRTCNKWWKGRVILAGDAAHVFPPYGGQGVTQGFLDVTSLAWRLNQALAPGNKGKGPNEFSILFDAWQDERKSNVKQSLGYTYKMRDIFEETRPIKLMIREIMLWLLQLLPYTRRKLQKPPAEPPEYEYSQGMAFLPDPGGGKTFSQCYCRGLDNGDPVTFSDDVVFSDKQKGFELVVLSDTVDDAVAAHKKLSSTYSSSSLIQSAAHIVSDLGAKHVTGSPGMRIARIASASEFAASPLCKGRSHPDRYDDHTLQKEYRGKRYIIVRADKVIFAACKDLKELSVALKGVERVRSCGVA